MGLQDYLYIVGLYTDICVNCEIVAKSYFFMLDDEKTNRYNIDWLIKSSTESINNAYYVSNIKLLLLF